jgi:hypothetical protein
MLFHCRWVGRQSSKMPAAVTVRKLPATSMGTLLVQSTMNIALMWGSSLDDKKQRPTSLPATIVLPDGTNEIRLFAAKEQPYFLIMPIWHLPGIALGKPPSPNFEIMQAHAYWFIPASMQKSTEMEQERVRAQGELNYTAFARAIARISYCTAVSLLGLDGFEHLDLPDLILGKYPHVPHYVGVMRTDPEPPEPRGRLHRIDVQEYHRSGRDYWLVSLRLFAHSSYLNHGMPTYRTIVGAPK